jgi:SpoVK/Ycf46/Vps4 family AAA+-type ATPase
LFTDRNRGGSGKLTTVLLQCLDDIKRWYEIDKTMKNNQTTPPGEGKRLVVIAATNTPWMIDSAFLRPGRFDRVVHVGLPSLSERKSILQVHIEKMRVRGSGNVDTIRKLCEELSILTEGFSGADIAALCRAAAVRALGQGEGISVEENHFQDALKLDVFPSSNDALVKRLNIWRP